MNIIFLIISLILSSNLNNIVYSLEMPKELDIEGLVENPLKISYDELRSFPQVWEIVELWCVEGYRVIKFNWTGVPLIYLLSKAKVKDNAKEVLFYASDGFTSSITLREAFDPTVILALEANGTILSEMVGREGGYRIILPCRWGYKWVAYISRIEVIDYDYKGLWESLGYSDEGRMPFCPETELSDRIFDLNFESYKIRVAGFTTGRIERASYNYDGNVFGIKIDFNSSSSHLINLFVENEKYYSHVDLFFDEKKIDGMLLGNQNITTILFENIEGAHTITILAYEKINEKENLSTPTILLYTLTIMIILAFITLILFLNYKMIKRKKRGDMMI
ncbi:MAG: molybdopterin-dependent oxidoreductase [Nitrososphaeria archaeon]